MDVLNTECVDQILEAQVEGENPGLHNACFSIVSNEGESNRIN